MLVLPRMTAPAALRRVTASASCVGCQPLKAAPRGRQTRNIEGFLHGDRQAEQRPALATRYRRIGRCRRAAPSLKVAHNDGVELAVARLDTGNSLIDEF